MNRPHQENDPKLRYEMKIQKNMKLGSQKIGFYNGQNLDAVLHVLFLLLLSQRDSFCTFYLKKVQKSCL